MRSSFSGRISRELSTCEYYSDRHVQQRILEYCGASRTKPGTAAFVSGLSPTDSWPRVWTRARRIPVSEIASLWQGGADLSRSLWDSEQLLFLFELDYQNVDLPAEPFLRPVEVLYKLEATYRAATRLFKTFQLPARAIVTGRGYHFAGAIPLTDPVIDELAALTQETPAWHSGVDNRRAPGVTTVMTERHARASEGLGRLLEHAAHAVLRDASRESQIPVVFNGVTVGAGRVGRECVSIDFSHAGDPLDIRTVRTVFSAYQAPRLRPDIFGTVAAIAPPLAAMPRERRSLIGLLTKGRDLESARQAAFASHVDLPDLTRGVGRLLADYRVSPLAAFHDAFYQMKRTLDGPLMGIDATDVPPCVTMPLEHPNDLLLKPEHIQHLVRGLMSRDWHPAKIAALVQSVYEQDHAWGDRWTQMHPQARAEFDVRVFAGLVATGLDSLLDFNCVSAQEKNLCPRTGCQYDLRDDRDRLLGSARA